MLIATFKIISDQNDKSKVKNLNDIVKCKDLDFSQSLFLHPKNFKKTNLTINILDSRRWNTLLLEEEILAKKNQLENNSDYKFYQTRKRVDAKIIIDLENQSKCYVKAKVRPHGDLSDHRSEDFLPSLNINLVDGHIFGIVKFILFKPITRGYDNEVISTTILSELNFLSPRTANAQVTYNNVTKNFIFQERIAKEFIEINNQLENPIYRGDERFTFSDKQKYNIQRSLFNHQFKPIDKKFITKGESEKYLTEIGLSILNELVLYDQGDVDTDDILDLNGAAAKTSYKDKFETFKIFDALLIAMDATHGFTPGNRRIYFDTTSKTFLPIYYDGQPNILDKKNNIIKKKLIDGSKIPINFKSPNVYFPGIFNGKVQKIPDNAVSEAYSMINNLNIKDLNDKLKIRGVEIKNEVLNNYINEVLKNLNYLKNLDQDKFIKSKKTQNNLIYIKDKNLFDKMFDQKKKKNINRLLVFYDTNINNFLVCDIFSENCKKTNISTKNIPDLISQDLKEKNKHLVFLGKYKNDNIFDGWYGIDEFNKFNKNRDITLNNFKIKKFGSIDISINKKDKKINVIKTGKDGKLLIHDGKINNWVINFLDNTSIEKSKVSRRDKNGLTGCVTFKNLEIEKLRIIANNANCEDAVNFIRSNGKIEEINISNSLFDGLDSDFSNLDFKKIIIKNSGNDCTDFSFGNYNINDSLMSHCGDKGISAGEISTLKVNKLNISNSKSAVASKDFSTVEIENFSSNFSENCLQAYNKKQEFSGGYIKSINFKCENYVNLIDVDKTSNIEILYK